MNRNSIVANSTDECSSLKAVPIGLKQRGSPRFKLNLIGTALLISLSNPEQLLLYMWITTWPF